jgi:FG-GAP-like repeat/Secretion system C-terminal sorting domain
MKLFLILAFTIGYTLFSQNLHQRFEGIPFSINSVTPQSPFNGGIEIPRYQFTDIDGDNDLDLFIFDKDTTLNFYRNEGNASSPLFRLNSVRYMNLNVRNWFNFADLDGDNDKDLFCGGDSQHVRYYRNVGSLSSPVFQLQTYGVRTNLNQFMDSEAASVPILVDIDADGDLDFFTGSSSGKITFYQNTGSPTNFVFTFITDFYKNIEIIGGAVDDLRHGASSITFADTDGDNDKDLYWGDLFGYSIYFIKNTGTAQNFNWNFIDTTSPEPNPYYSGGFNMPGIFDINNDGRNDFFIGVLIGSKSIDNFVYFRNDGPLNNPAFTKVTDNFILSADIGSYSYPAASDIDNDGDKDLFIGCDHSVAFFRNTGSAGAPAYTLVNDSLALNISNFNYAPSLGDLDGDGKKDLVLGYYATARLKFFRNTGTVTNPVFTYQSSQLDTMNLQQSSAPLLVDIDNDGDLDIIAGNSSGRLTHYRNNGNASAFSYQFITNNYLNASVGNDAAPTAGDLDGDGDLDLLVGNRVGLIHFYRNTGTVSSPVFAFVTNNYAGVNTYQNAVPLIMDVNNDSDPDLFVGNTKGGLYFYENWDVFGIQQTSSEIPDSYKLFQNYPNPFNPMTNVKIQIPNNGFVNLIVYNITGKEVAVLVNEELNAGEYSVDFDASHLASGVYFYRLAAGEYSEVRKMVLLK